MKLASVAQLPATLREFYNIVKTLKVKEARKDASKAGALTDLVGFLGEEKSVLIVTQNGMALCDVNPQSHAEFDRTDTSPEITDILDAEKALKEAQAKLSAAMAAGKAAKLVTYPKKDSIRLEVLSDDKVQDMRGKFGAEINKLRRGKKAALVAAAA